MSHDPIDDYLAELIGEATAEKSKTNQDPAGDIVRTAEASEPALQKSIDADADSSIVNQDVCSEPAQEPIAAQAQAWTSSLMDELDNDPLFAGQNEQPAAPTEAVAADTTVWTNALLDELADDPLFAGQIDAADSVPATDETAGTAMAADTALWTSTLLDELADDPLFAGQLDVPGSDDQATVSGEAVPLAAQTDLWTNELLAELDTDPNFAAQKTSAPQVPDPASASPAASPTASVSRTESSPAARIEAPPSATPLWQARPLDRAENPVAHPRNRATDRVSRWLRLRCGEQPYAIELLKVQEVVLLSPLLHLRGTQAHILGIMNLRGQVVPVMDLGVFLNGIPAEETATTRIIVLESEGQTLGLRVSAVDDVASLTDSQIEPPDTTRLCRFSNHLFRGVARLGGPPMILLDADALLN